MMLPELRFAVKPGHVRSRHDGQLHYVGYGQLVRLYGLNGKRCVMYNETMRDNEYIILGSRSEGDYKEHLNQQLKENDA